MLVAILHWPKTRAPNNCELLCCDWSMATLTENDFLHTSCTQHTWHSTLSSLLIYSWYKATFYKLHGLCNEAEGNRQHTNDEGNTSSSHTLWSTCRSRHTLLIMNWTTIWPHPVKENRVRDGGWCCNICEDIHTHTQAMWGFVYYKCVAGSGTCFEYTRHQLSFLNHTLLSSSGETITWMWPKWMRQTVKMRQCH